MSQNFKNLEAWQMARSLRNDIKEMTITFPKDEKFKLTDQMIRASRSVTANIAEGFGRYHFQENIQFCRHARGSLTELIDHLSVANDEGYIEEQQRIEFETKIESCLKILNGYIRFLKSSKDKK